VRWQAVHGTALLAVHEAWLANDVPDHHLIRACMLHIGMDGSQKVVLRPLLPRQGQMPHRPTSAPSQMRVQHAVLLLLQKQEAPVKQR
jgi:hypothetical protein